MSDGAATLVEHHRHGGGGENLGYRREIKQGFRNRLRRDGIVGEAAQGAQGNEFVSLRDSNRCGGKCAVGDGVFKRAKSGSESHILVVIGGERKSGGLGLGASQNDALMGVMAWL